MKKLILVPVLICLLLFSCGKESEVSGNQTKLPVIYTSIPPLEFILGYITGDEFEVKSLLSENDNPHTYSIKPSDLRQLKQAELLIQIGGGFENYLTDPIRSNLKDLKIIDIAPHLSLITAEMHDDEDKNDSHSENGEHSDFDPHFWLGIPQVLEYAEFISSELIRIYPAKKELFSFNLSGFKATVSQIDSANRMILENRKSDSFLVFHPSYSYFAEYYNLDQIAVEVDGKAPSPKQLKNVIETANKHDIKVLISQPQFSSTSIQAIAQAIDGKAIIINHLNMDIFSTMTDLCLALTRSTDDSE